MTPTALAPTGVRVEAVVSPAPRAEWRAVVDADPTALVDQGPEWTDLVTATAPFVDRSRLYRLSDGRRFVVPLVERRRPPVARIWSSMPPSWGIGGVVGPDRIHPAPCPSPPPRDRPALRALLDDLAATPVASVRLRPDPLDADLWAAARPADAVVVARRAHVLDLGGGIDAVWSRLSRSTRRHVRKGEQAGLEVTDEVSDRTLRAYYGLYERSLERWAAASREPRRLALLRGRRRDPYDRFAAVAAALGGRLRLWTAWKDGEAVAGIVVRVGNAAHYSRGAMDVERAGPTHASHLLHWTAITELVETGVEVHHLGDTGTSSSLAQFKEGLGARPVDYAEVRLERLPLTGADRLVRTTGKRLIGFRDAT